MHHVTLRRVLVTTVALEKQQIARLRRRWANDSFPHRDWTSGVDATLVTQIRYKLRYFKRLFMTSLTTVSFSKYAQGCGVTIIYITQTLMLFSFCFLLLETNLTSAFYAGWNCSLWQTNERTNERIYLAEWQLVLWNYEIWQQIGILTKLFMWHFAKFFEF